MSVLPGHIESTFKINSLEFVLTVTSTTVCLLSLISLSMKMDVSWYSCLSAIENFLTCYMILLNSNASGISASIIVERYWPLEYQMHNNNVSRDALNPSNWRVRE